jgi:hypothetical protein
MKGSDLSIPGLGGTRASSLQCGGTVLEELLLPAIESGRLDLMAFTDLRDGLALQEVLAEDCHLLLMGVVFSWLPGHWGVLFMLCNSSTGKLRFVSRQNN